MEKLKNIHPGEVLLEEFLLPLKITAYRLSKDNQQFLLHKHDHLEI
jgi:plasmid maintenance system antidote protein VapI